MRKANFRLARERRSPLPGSNAFTELSLIWRWLDGKKILAEETTAAPACNAVATAGRRLVAP
jgi:hypothetical protein